MVTVFTPTYNREKLLHKLYEALKSQTSQDFEWLIVDDGSVDNTKDVVKSWINEDIIKIRYIYQENMGKHIAFNNGVNNARGELFFCIDSDDFPPENCVETIISFSDKIKDESIAGIIALKSDFSGNLLSDELPRHIIYTTTYDLSAKYNCRGDLTLIYKTEILKQFPYPETVGEKFVGECVVYDKIDQYYKMFLSNEILTICEYQPDGLTANIVSTMLKNPTGYKIYYRQRIDMAYTTKERFGYIIRYNAFDILSKDNNYNYKGKYALLILISKPLGWLLTKYYNFKKRK